MKTIATTLGIARSHLHDRLQRTDNEQSCKTILDGVPLYRDAGHLSVIGSRKLGEALRLGDLIIKNAS